MRDPHARPVRVPGRGAALPPSSTGYGPSMPTDALPLDSGAPVLRPRGTSALIYAVVSGAVGLVLYLTILVTPALQGGGIGLIVAAVSVVVGLAAGGISRLAGGTPRPVRLQRTVWIAAGLPVIASATSALLIGAL